MESKNLVMIHLKDTWNDAIPLKDSPKTRESFEKLFIFARTRGIEPYRASIHWYNIEKNIFTKAWTFNGSEWIRVEKNITPHFIFDKVAGRHDYRLFDLKMQMAHRAVVFNSPLFRSLFDSKLSQYVIFQKFMPLSLLVTNTTEFEQAIKKIPSDKIVIKPLYGSGGFGISIVQKTELHPQTFNEFPLLLQAFVVTGGVPQISPRDEVADLRIVYINHKPVYSLSRIAKTGSLFTNFHQGATARLIPLKQIPPQCKKMAKDIITTLSVFPKANYSLDFMFTENGTPVLIEMNTTPGFDLLLLVGTPKILEHFFSELLSDITPTI